MRFIKEMNIEGDLLHVRLEKGVYIHDYELQKIRQSSDFLPVKKDRRAKSRMCFERSHTCTLKSYLQQTVLEELSFIRLLIDVLEGIQRISKDHYVIMETEAIVFQPNGRLAFAVLPIMKTEFIELDDDLHMLLCDIVKAVHIHDGRGVLGMLVSHLKNRDIHCVTLLQELHQCLPVMKKPSFLQRFLWKEPMLPEVSYPLPDVIKPKEETSYVKEIEEPCEKTMMLFSYENGYLEDAQNTFDICSSRFTIGRKADSDCCLDMPSISKEHAVIIQEADGFYIQDLHSSNATYLNGNKLTPLEPVMLHDNDELMFADTVFQFHESKQHH